RNPAWAPASPAARRASMRSGLAVDAGAGAPVTSSADDQDREISMPVAVANTVPAMSGIRRSSAARIPPLRVAGVSVGATTADILTKCSDPGWCELVGAPHDHTGNVYLSFCNESFPIESPGRRSFPTAGCGETSMTLLLVMVLAAFSVVFSPIVVRVLDRKAGWPLALIFLAAAYFLIREAGPILDGTPLTWEVVWIRDLIGTGTDVMFSLRADALSLFFALLALVIGAIV